MKVGPGGRVRGGGVEPERFEGFVRFARGYGACGDECREIRGGSVQDVMFKQIKDVTTQEASAAKGPLVISV